jgi:hypothetical protein
VWSRHGWLANAGLVTVRRNARKYLTNIEKSEIRKRIPGDLATRKWRRITDERQLFDATPTHGKLPSTL